MFGAVASAALGASTCTPVSVFEDTPAACSNGVDDDEDGRTDCDDPACAATDACEVTALVCANGIDEDRDGDVDCEDRSCVDGGFCAPYAAECSLSPQGGCTTGMGCYLLTEETRECRVAGVGMSGDACEPATGDAPSECEASTDCLSHTCTSFCTSDWDCTRESFCILAPELVDYGICSVPCDRVLQPGDADCVEGLVCRSGHSYESAFDNRGAYWFCLPPAAAHANASGTEGAPCDDPPTSATPDERVCAPDFACAPDATGEPACRKLCDVGEDGTTVLGCGADEDCVVFYPLDDRPAAPFDLTRLGACMPR